MARKITGDNYGAELLEMLGIDPQGVIGFSIKVFAEEPVTITLTRYVEPSEMECMLGWVGSHKEVYKMTKEV